jgi:energy-coupling factor transport system substrate-specific component
MNASSSTKFSRIKADWRVADIVVASVVGVAAGLIFFLWNQIYTPISAPLQAALPGAQALVYGIWLIAGVLGGLIIRKPGAALYTETVAAVVSALLGAQWGGFLTLESGVVQGLGAEIIFLIFLYSNWRAWVAMLAGAGAGLAMAISDLIIWYPGSKISFAIAYIVSSIITGAIVAGLGAWFIVKGLAKTGVLNRFAAGREAKQLV